MRDLSKGYTLIEILVALSILGIAITVILQLFSANLRAISRSEDYVHALIKADIRMRELLQSEDLQEKIWSETTDSGHRVDVVITEILKEKTETLQFSLMEIHLTISWRENLKSKSYSFKTLKTVAKKI
ncbi:MAG: prepilin-type N-terminal cleavage/methylation domain-containing protein [Thermodesulfovibrionales bacterium]|nr:prepilin-type N-terminal cleavage/methylation domain-containing protein [Thermodesulfovibrionales bacterium]